MPPRIENEARVQRLLKAVLAFARARVEYADILYERAVRIEIQQLADGLIPKPFNARARVQLRLVHKGRKAEVKVGTLDIDLLKESVELGLKLLKASPMPARPIRLAPIPNPKKQHYGLRAPRAFPSAAIFEALAGGIAALARRAERAHPGIEVKPEFWFFSQREEKAVADTAGVFKTQVLPRTFLQLVTRVKGPGGRLTQTRARLGNVKPYDYIVAHNRQGRLALAPAAARNATEWIGKTIELQDAVTLSSEQVRSLSHLVLHYTTAGVFVHEALGHNFEADIVKAGSSGIIDAQGTPRGEVACADVDILDGPLDDDFTEGFGTEFIDDEGVEVQPKLLAAKGRVVGMIHNRETAAYFGVEPNGGAFSESGDMRIPRMSNTYIRPATRERWHRTLDRLIADVPRGILLVGTSGGAVSKDGMSSSVQLGYLVENGKVTRTVRPSNFAAKTLQALRHVDGFAGPVQIDDVGFCGKGQTRYVGDGAPTWTRIRNNESISLSVQG
jgi:predicted Zn-dependent protease